MEPSSSLWTVIGSGLLAAVVSATVSRINTERNIIVENITRERKDWREKIRTLSSKIFDAFYESNVLQLKKLKSEFVLNLNSNDKDDTDILNHIDKLIEACHQKEDSVINEFTTKVSLLLKHDWERAKIEASPLENIGRVVDRVSFEDHKRKISR